MGFDVSGYGHPPCLAGRNVIQWALELASTRRWWFEPRFFTCSADSPVRRLERFPNQPHNTHG